MKDIDMFQTLKLSKTLQNEEQDDKLLLMRCAVLKADDRNVNKATSLVLILSALAQQAK